MKKIHLKTILWSTLFCSLLVIPQITAQTIPPSEKETGANSQQLFTSLLNPDKSIALPLTPEKITESLGVEPVATENRKSQNGNSPVWKIQSGLTVALNNVTDDYQEFTLSTDGNNKISGLPLGLTFNESTFEECRGLFSQYKIYAYNNTYPVSDNEDRAYMVLEFKRKNQYIKLSFAHNNTLSAITISNLLNQ